MKKIIAKYKTNDIEIRYIQGKNRKNYDVVGLQIFPLEMSNQVIEDDCDLEPLIQVKMIGDDYPFNYSQGRTMRNSQSTFKLKFKCQKEIVVDSQHQIITTLNDDRGIIYHHYLIFSEQSDSLEIYSKIINNTSDEIKLEMLSSFTLGSITPFTKGLAREALVMHQIKSTWSYEGRLVSHPIEEYMLEPSWKPSGANGIRFGQIGSMPNREYFPFVAIEDINANVCWGVQLAIASSWQLEVYRKDDALCLSGGIADREMGHWIKCLKSDEEFTTPKAIVSTVCGGVDQLSQRIVRNTRLDIKKDEQKMPIIFNEFCTTWGNPKAEDIKNIVDLLYDKGISYFVIDCGWYKKSVENNDLWNIQHGDWLYNQELFSNGIKEVVDYIHQKGMKAGIWFEFESCGREADLFNQTELLYKRDGFVITAGNRRFLNMLDNRVINYLDQRVIDFLRDNEFDYLKIDYNANLGIGMDNGDSLGEQLYQGISASINYIKKIKKELPDLVIENCSAGGHRLVEPFLKLTDMSSFSDAHESLCIPIVGANLHRMILPRQSQIWAVIQPDQDLETIYYKISSAMLGRLCLSGNITDLTDDQWQVVQRGICFYKQISHIIDLGNSIIDYQGGLSYKEPTGYQVVKRVYGDEMLIIIHTFAKCPSQINVNVENYSIVNYYGTSKLSFRNNHLILSSLNEYVGMVLYMVKKNG